VYERLRKENRALGDLRNERGSVFNLAEIDNARGDTQQAIAPADRERLLAEGAALTPEAAIALALDEP